MECTQPVHVKMRVRAGVTFWTIFSARRSGLSITTQALTTRTTTSEAKLALANDGFCVRLISAVECGSQTEEGENEMADSKIEELALKSKSRRAS